MHQLLTLKLTPSMCETSKREALERHQLVASMMESLYWMGIDQPAKSTILPVGIKQITLISHSPMEMHGVPT